jgi:isopentenyl diphosphate isomerase/L-lactate dehydrogenase-like FMN-dependent dehydrogenase
MNIEKRFPCVADLETAALRRLPRFVREYLMGGIGNGVGVQKNRDAMNAVELMPRYLAEADQPNLSCHLLGRNYDAPFGVAPIGLAGLVWPRAETILATAAKAHNIPYVLSTVATASLEDIREVAGENSWFQLYTPREPKIRKDLMGRCEQAGYDTLVVTVDVPYQTRREHDIRNGLSVPPRFNLTTLCQIMGHPPWALHMLFSGIPRFANLERYYDQGLPPSRSKSNIQQSVQFIKERLGLHISRGIFEDIRTDWPGKLLVKGVLDPEEARTYLALGADGIIVSNHGGRQLDAAPSSVSVLPYIREAVGPDATLIADSGARSGLDVARMLALGADFVMMGRAFMFGVAALGHRGGDHVMNILKAELQSAMGQLGCATIEELPKALVSSNLERGSKTWPMS